MSRKQHKNQDTHHFQGMDSRLHGNDGVAGSCLRRGVKSLSPADSGEQFGYFSGLNNQWVIKQALKSENQQFYEWLVDAKGVLKSNLPS